MVFAKRKAASISLLLFTYISIAQPYFSERLNVDGKTNLTFSFRYFNDTFHIPVGVTESFNAASSSLLKIDKLGNIILHFSV